MRTLTINGKARDIPPYPSPEDYIYRCRKFFFADSLKSFVNVVPRRQALRESVNGFRYRCLIPRDILIDPTNACNMRCKGCWAGDYDKAEHLSYQTLSGLMAELKKLGTLDVLMTGGEPLLRREDILRLAKEHPSLFYGVFTNGTLVDEALARRMKELGNITLFLSIEGWREDTDFRRGEGAFDRTTAAMRLLKQADLPFGFSLCYHKKNWRTVTSARFLDFLQEQGAWFGWAFAYRPIGKGADLSLCLSAPEREEARLNLARYSAETDVTVIDLFNSGHKVYGCVGAGSGYLHINAKGDVEPCAFCHYSDSNIHDMPLRKALQSPFMRAFRRSQPFSSSPLRPCPMTDAPDAIVSLTERTGARSTHSGAPETARDFAQKIEPYAREWEEWVNTDAQPLSDTERGLYDKMIKLFRFRKRLSGDLKK